MSRSRHRLSYVLLLKCIAVGFLLTVALGCSVETRFQLTTVGQPVDGGEVSVNPAPGADNKYREGTMIELQALPREGYMFSHWAPSVLGLGTRPFGTITMSGNIEVTAVFQPTSVVAAPTAEPSPSAPGPEPTTPAPRPTTGVPSETMVPATTATSPAPGPTSPAPPTATSLPQPTTPVLAQTLLCPNQQHRPRNLRACRCRVATP